MADKGKLYVISAPSGGGKTTLIQNVLQRFNNLAYSVSHTTRTPRKNEQQGVDYFFISQKEFKEKIKHNLLLEWAKVHENYYGTSRDFIITSLDKGKSLILDVDVQGARQIMESAIESGMNIVSIFIMPPSIKALAQRLEHRGTDSKKVIEMRLKNAKTEIDKKNMYQHVVINDDLDHAKEDLCKIFEETLNKAMV